MRGKERGKIWKERKQERVIFTDETKREWEQTVDLLLR